ncbi:MAG: UvrD-helicase domain-containing protein [Candidatus Babeliaceae bacterium]|nr:UvrD-helicase domain-containing protein [Candidatus Babeliaceae bacterium]
MTDPFVNIEAEFKKFFDTQLNPEQQQAVAEKDGVLLVCAGAGSGKTRVITARMTNLMLMHHVTPYSIVALTFTNKAAREMKERIAHFLPGYQLPYVGTFHSYCLRLLKVYRHHLAHTDFSILDEDDKEKMLKSIINKYGLVKKVTVKALAGAISQHKNSLMGISDPLLEELCNVYEREKTNAHCLDFDDLLLEVLKLFRTNAEFKKDFQQKVRHVLVDEYQDTNVVQHALLQQITQDEKQQFCIDSLCVVGDEDQSIYSWRGATIQNIVYFKRDFPQTTTITIAQNYRSVQPILDTANALIDHNSTRNPKKLWSAKKGTDRIRRIQCASSYQEGDIVAQLASTHIKKNSGQSIAVLYRSHYQSRALEEALIRGSIPYKIIGGVKFYDRQEIKDLLAYMRLVVNPFDRISLSRIINVPSRGLGDKFIEQLMQLWDQQPFLNGFQILQHMLTEKTVSGIKAESVRSFINLFYGFTREDGAQKVAEYFIEKNTYFEYLKEHFAQEDAQAKIGNVKELLNAIAAFSRQEQHAAGTFTVEQFLEEVALLQEHIIDETTHDYISLMTLHAAKGLEFDTVILTGLEENILPSTQATFAQESVEEERRLLYVGITRARERLLLTHVRYRYIFGTMTDQRTSRFVHELPESIDAIDCSQWNTSNIHDYIREWYLEKPSYKRPTPVHAVKPKLIIPESVFSDEPENISQEVPEPVHLRVNQRVRHATYGIGTIKDLEERGQDTLFATVQFGTKSKKISANFLSEL